MKLEYINLKIRFLLKSVLIIVLLYSHPHFASPHNYCIALRGNGELIPSHWGAISHTIETFGYPKAIAGGSSASISSFLLDQLSRNPYLESLEDENQKALILAFLYKSLQGYFLSQWNQPEWQNFIKFVSLHSEDSLLSILNKLLENVRIYKIRDILKVLKKIKDSKVLYGPSIERLHLFLQKMSYFSYSDWQTLKKLSQQVRLSISVIGKFDAKNDNNLLIRDGVIHFPSTVDLYSRIAGFYRNINMDTITQNRFSHFIQICSKNSLNQTWNQIIKKDPFCQRAMDYFVNTYKEIQFDKSQILDQPIGESIPAILTAAIVKNQSAFELQKAKLKLDQEFDTQAGDIFLDSKDIYFSYFGNQNLLQAAEINLKNSLVYSQVDKSKRFLSLGHLTWREGLELSANEPGLSSFIKLSPNTLAIGGWSDLHPTLVLKAANCENVVYVTRKGGDTLFGQGLSKRIFNFSNISWENLDPLKASINQKTNNNGIPEDQSSLWSQMYNLANPSSSFSASLKSADAVVCTDWNHFDVATQFSELIEESYNAPIFNPSEISLLHKKTTRFLTKSDNALDPQLGFYKYSGCIPLDN